jgi:uncharacterized protein DUF2867
MRVANAVHAAHPWVIARIAPDFELLDAWALPVEGDAADFDPFLDAVSSFDPEHAESLPTRALFRLRFRLGELLGWDERAAKRPIPGCTETSLRDRLPDDLRSATPYPAIGAIHGFVPLYRTGDEWAGEISNATVHGVLQLAWVAQGDGRYRGRLGVYVKPRGRSGAAYMALIGPFRHLVVYPALLRQIGRAWQARRPDYRFAGSERA